MSRPLIQQHLTQNQSPIFNTPTSATSSTASINMPSSAACTYHLFQNTYTCDPKQSTAILKTGLQQALETANTTIGEYFNRRLLPLYEAHPFITGWVTLVVVMLGILMVTFHAWTGEAV
ncbi:hypothetical protein G7Y79_00009g026370 [Physcia stellaris]|nr:hypothetical protein G7Y79_00009g026370 [Physcia stellaris]